MAKHLESDKLESYRIKVATLERNLAVMKTSLRVAEKRISKLEKKIIDLQEFASRSSYGPRRVR